MICSGFSNERYLAKVSHSEVAHSACGADERGTQPLYEHVSHSNPRENVFSVGLVWDTLAKEREVIGLPEFRLGRL